MSGKNQTSKGRTIREVLMAEKPLEEARRMKAIQRITGP
jgi:hypothetical protein